MGGLFYDYERALRSETKGHKEVKPPVVACYLLLVKMPVVDHGCGKLKGAVWEVEVLPCDLL